MHDEQHPILPMVVYPRQLLGVPPGLMTWAVVGLTILAVLIGFMTGDVIQVEAYALYLPVHWFLRRAYRADPFVASVWYARLWNRQPWGAPFAIFKRTQNRMQRPLGVNRFS